MFSFSYVIFDSMQSHLCTAPHGCKCTLWKALIKPQALSRLSMKHEAEQITHIIHQLSFESVHIFSCAVSRLLSMPRPKLC